MEIITNSLSDNSAIKLELRIKKLTQAGGLKMAMREQPRIGVLVVSAER